MTFPYITHIDQLKEKVGHMKEIRFMEQENGFTVVCYMISDEDTFHGENAEWARECRGITFDRDGKIASRPLHKFFNVGECEETQKYNLNWAEIINVMDKRDGSMIHPVLVNDRVVFKSKKSFTSDVAKYANEFLRKNKNYYDFCEYMLMSNRTPIFEFTAPNSRIVINYGSEPQMKLLHLRDNYTGQYGQFLRDDFMVNHHKIEVVDAVEGEPQELMKGLEDVQGIEGYIFQFADGNMVKAKSKWYLELHRTIVFLRERDIVELVLDEKIDDVKSILSVEDKYQFEKICAIEHDVKNKILSIMENVENVFNENKHLSRKEFAIKLNNLDIFSLLMKKYSGSDINYNEYYKKKYLQFHSLEQI